MQYVKRLDQGKDEMADQGIVEVGGIAFSWSVIDGDDAVITVSHPDYGSQSEPKTLPAEIEARLIAKDLLARRRRE